MTVSYITVSGKSDLKALIRHLESSSWVGLDTEFISERKYQPQLCLIQISAEGILAIIDPMATKSLAEFWDFLCDHDHETIVHAFRSEMEFCYRFVRKLPKRVFDIQLAAGLVGFDYPCSFRGLLERLLQVNLSKGETRTDWTRRPLSHRQIDYALNDVRYLSAMSKKLKKTLRTMNRTNWYEDEMSSNLNHLLEEWNGEKWRNLSGLLNLSAREAAIARELWFWRDRRAAEADIPQSYILRDDLIVELAKRKSADPRRIKVIRGLQRTDIIKQLPEISQAILRGLDCPESELPVCQEKNKLKQFTQMSQLINSGLAMLCHKQNIAPNIVATPQDIREFIAYRTDRDTKNIARFRSTPRLATGWRANLVGDFLEDFLEGKVVIRFNKANPKEPLQFVNCPLPDPVQDDRFLL